MKILVLAPRPLRPEHDGGTVATARCIRGLASAGAELSLLSMKTEKHPEICHSGSEKIPQYVAAYTTVSVDTRIRPAAMARNLLFSSEPYDLVRFRSPVYSEALRTHLNNGHFDIIQCEGLSMALYLNEIRKLTDSPVILRAHNLEHKIRQMMAAEELSPVRKAYLSNLSRRLLAVEKQAAVNFDAVVPISEPDFIWFTEAAKGKPVCLSETGAEEAVRIPEPPCADLRVGFIGSMNWHPNITGIKWFINKVWPCVLEKIPSATLQIAGRGLQQHETVLPSGKNIVIAGETEDARAFMASCHVIIAPLFSGSGLRIKIIDAMSAGRPVVATPVAAEGLQAVNGRELAVAGNPESFCSALSSLLQDHVRRAAMGDAAVALVKERYHNAANTMKLLEFYKRLIHDR
ncbi:MAG: glycosyltransferase family 4 protein [Bacteroidales bacterium]|jgi:glycosyltransferase involved in cell wall biosynthesis|nr:glycosyltransferase family 4 protein [Bacteroidales bacterium]